MSITPRSVGEKFAEHFSGKAKLFRAPARVNIIGEHTDYNDGLVLPTTTALFTWVAATSRSDRIVRLYSEHFADLREFDLDSLNGGANPRWTEYVKGVAAVLEGRGITLRGADLYLAGDIPLGGGLSSSASLELASGMALLGVAGRTLGPQELALLCQRAEIEHVGLNCGSMDQLAVACCPEGCAMLLDCRTSRWETVSLPDELRLLLVDSGVKHELPGDGYNDRATECRQAVECLQKSVPGFESLRDLSQTDLESNRDVLGDTLYRRCRHVVSEIARTAAARDALIAGDLDAIGSLVSQSHASLRDDYEVSCPGLDTLAEIALGCDRILGARMVGAGFGGCVIALARAESADSCRRRIVDAYARASGRSPWSHIVAPAPPAQILSNDGRSG